MMRGTFANIRIKNQMVAGVEGGVTKHEPDGTVMPIYDAAMRYKSEGVPLVVFAGKEYGTGSSRDWAAKGTRLLGVRAVVAESFERIHRSNLVGMGVLPLVFAEGMSWQKLGIKGDETVTIRGLEDGVEAAPDAASRDHRRRGQGRARAADQPDRYPRRARILQQWRNTPLRPETARRMIASCTHRHLQSLQSLNRS